MTFTDQLKDLDRFLPLEKLEEATRLPIRFSPETIQGVIPSIVLGTDGPVLARLLLVTKKFLCDVSLADATYPFDYVETRTITNYRFEVWTHSIKDGDIVKATYDVARIQLIHGGVGPTFRTQLEYAGEQRDTWLDNLVHLIPVQILEV